MTLRQRALRAVTPAGLAIAVLSALAIGLYRSAEIDPVTNAFERQALELRFRLRGAVPASDDIVVVDIDEQAMAAIGMLAPLRATLADALRRIAEARPRVVAIDLLLVDTTAADIALASALAGAGAVVLAVSFTNDPATLGATPPPETEAALEKSQYMVVIDDSGRPQAAKKMLLPVPSFAAAAFLGHVNVFRSQDGVARQLPLALETVSGHTLPAMPVTAARLALGLASGAVRLYPGSGLAMGEHWIPTDRNGRMTINHPGGSEPFKKVRLLDIIDGNTPTDIFSGRIVFIGSTAESLGDSFATPFAERRSGVEVLAAATSNILRGEALRHDRGTAILSIAIAVLASIAVGLAGAVRPRRSAIAAALAVWAAALAFVQFAFQEWLLWLDAVTIIAALAVGSLVVLSRRQAIGENLRRKVQREYRNLSRYVAPVLRDTLARAETPDFDRRVQDAAVLFVDVAGYTKAVERTDPAAVAAFLAELHGYFEETASVNGGLVVDFQGDGAIVVFGLPQASRRDAQSALACADALIAGIGRLATPLFGEGVKLRVSVHFGPVAAAVLGGHHGQVTVTGDTVNVASRLQDVAKRCDVGMVTTSSVLVAAGIDPLDRSSSYVFLDRETMRGRSQEIDIFTRRTSQTSATSADVEPQL